MQLAQAQHPDIERDMSRFYAIVALDSLTPPTEMSEVERLARLARTAESEETLARIACSDRATYLEVLRALQAIGDDLAHRAKGKLSEVRRLRLKSLYHHDVADDNRRSPIHTNEYRPFGLEAHRSIPAWELRRRFRPSQIDDDPDD